MECISLVHRPAVDPGPRETTAPPFQANIDAGQIEVDLQEVPRERAHKRSWPVETNRRGMDNRGQQQETSGQNAAKPKKPARLEQARKAPRQANNAGLPTTIVTSLEEEVKKLAVQRAAAKPIGAQIDVAKARLARASKAEEGLTRWDQLQVQIKAKQQETLHTPEEVDGGHYRNRAHLSNERG